MKPILKKIFVFAIIFFAAVSAFSESLSIQVFQKNPGQDKVWVTSQIFEQGALDFFFESGHIVSNSPCFVSKDTKTDNIERRHSIADAYAGHLNYFGEVVLFYTDGITTSSEDALLGHIKKAHWKLFDCATGKMLYEGENEPEKITSQNNDEYGVFLFAQQVASNINSKLGNSGW